MNMHAWMTLAWQQAKTAASAPSPDIPYQIVAPISNGTFAFALLATVLLLTVTVGGLLFARKRGWIPTSARRRSDEKTENNELIASRRLSAVTTAHLVACRGRSYLVVESLRGSAATLLPLDEREKSTGEAP